MARLAIAILGLILINLVLIGVASGHPGGTDSSGCHHCRTNCPSWGYNKDEYHCHGGSGSGGGSSYTYSSTYSSNARPTASMDHHWESRHVVHLTDTSTDDGSITSRTWVITRTSSSTTILESTENSWEAELPGNGSYTVTLTVSDSSGSQDSSTVTLTIGPPFAHWNSPPHDLQIAANVSGEIIHFWASATDPDGDALQYTWAIGDSMQTGASIDFIPKYDGTIEASVSVTDLFSPSVSAATTVTFVGPGTPHLELAGPREAPVGQPIRFLAKSWDFSGDNVTLNWSIPGTPITASGAVLEWTPTAVGPYEIVIAAQVVSLNATYQTVKTATFTATLPITTSSNRPASQSEPEDASLTGITPALALLLGLIIFARRRV